MRFIKRHEKCLILILAALQVLLQVNLSPSVEINHPFFVTLTEYDALALVEIDISTVEFDQFTNTHSR